MDANLWLSSAIIRSPWMTLQRHRGGAAPVASCTRDTSLKPRQGYNLLKSSEINWTSPQKSNQIIKPKHKQSAKSDHELFEPPVVLEVGRPGHDNSALLHSIMKRSFHYCKITLRHEKPLYVSKHDGANSSDEKGENENGGAYVTIHEELITKVSPTFAVETSGTPGINMRHNLSPGSSLPHVLCKVRANSYSKVTLGGLKSPDVLSERGNKCARHKLSLVESVSGNKDGENQAAEERVIPSPLSPDVFNLPAHPPNNSFLYNPVISLNSLDSILVDPPSRFDSDDNGEKDGTSSELRTTLISIVWY